MKKFLARLLAMSIGATLGFMIMECFEAVADFLWEITNGSHIATNVIFTGGVVLIVCVLWSAIERFIEREVTNEE